MRKESQLRRGEPTLDEDRAHEESGFSTEWTAKPPYEINDMFLVEVGAVGSGRHYYPIVEISIAGELAKVSDAELDLTEFATQYGLLGRFNMVPSDVKRREMIEAGGLRGKKYKTKYPLDADPIDWIMAHARSVKMCLELICWIEEEDETALDHTISNFPDPPFGLGWGTSHLNFRKKYVESRKGRPDISPISHAHRIVERIINPNIVGVSRRFHHFGPRPKSRWRFQGMIEAVYWQLADRYEHGGIRRCRDPKCGRTFIARDKRQFYCPGSNRKPSKCRSRHNVEQHRERNKGEA